MPQNLTLDQARKILNMPYASVGDVVKAAQKAGIVINLTGIENNVNLGDLGNKVGRSVFGPSLTSQNAQNQGGSLASSLNFDTNFKLNNPSLSNMPSLNAPRQNQSVFGIGFNRPTSNSPSLLQSDGVIHKQTFDFSENGNKSSILDNFLSMSMFGNKSDKSITFVDGNVTIDMSQVKSQEFFDGGKIRYTLLDGSVVEKQLSEDTLKQIGGERQLSRIDYQDGKAIYYDLDGNPLRTRDAFKGEQGYVKDGNSIEEDLVAVLGQDRMAKLKVTQEEGLSNIAQNEALLAELTEEKIAEIEKTDPKRAESLRKQVKALNKSIAKSKAKLQKQQEAIARDYIKKVYNECDGDADKIVARIESLIKNSDFSTEASKQMANILGSFYEKTKGKSKEDVTRMLADIMDASTSTGSTATADMADPITRMKGEQGKGMRASYAEAAQRTDNIAVATDALIDNAENVIDAETGEVDREQAVDIGRTITQLGGDDGAIKLGQKVRQMDSDEAKIGYNGAIDEQGAKTGNKEVIRTSVEVITSMESADAQVEATENSHIIYEEMGASDETKKARAEVVATNIGAYHEDAQLAVDKIERHYDIDNFYNQNVAHHIQEVASKNQKEMAQRTVDSGDEKAMTNLANHAYELDPDNVDEVVKMLKEQGSEKTKQALDEAKVRYEEEAEAKANLAKQKADEQKRQQEAEVKAQAQAQAQAQAKAQAQQKSQSSTAQRASTKAPEVSPQPRTIGFSNFSVKASNISFGADLSSISKTIVSKEFKEKSVAQKKEFLDNLSTDERAVALGKMVETSSAMSLRNMMFSALKFEILGYLVKNASAQNNQKLHYLELFLTPADKKQLDEMKEKHAKQTQTKIEE